MTLSFACPHCGKTYRNVKQKLIGKKARCSCGNVIRIGKTVLPEQKADLAKADLLDGPNLELPGPKISVPTVELKQKNIHCRSSLQRPR